MILQKIMTIYYNIIS